MLLKVTSPDQDTTWTHQLGVCVHTHLRVPGVALPEKQNFKSIFHRLHENSTLLFLWFAPPSEQLVFLVVGVCVMLVVANVLLYKS